MVSVKLSRVEKADRKMRNVIYANCGTFYDDGIIIIGDDNILYGDHCKITGNNATSYGDHCKITGNNATSYGDRCEITGDNATSYGNRCEITGEYAIVHGKHCKVNGTNAKVVEGSSANLNISTGVYVDSGSYASSRPSTMNISVLGSGCVVGGDVNISNTTMIGRSYKFSHAPPSQPSVPANPVTTKTVKEEKSIDWWTKLNRDHDNVAPDGTPDEKTCDICYSNLRKVIFIPCGHLQTCIACAKTIGEKSICPSCRTPIENGIERFL